MDAKKNTPMSEQETIINFSPGDKQADIYSSDPVVIRRLKKYADENPDKISVIMDNASGIEVLFPMDWISFKPRKKRVMSEEQRQANAERLRSYREVRQ